MKLAEALILRADRQKRIAQLRARLVTSAKVQEGEQPPENPQELLEELARMIDELTDLIKRINKTNLATELETDMTLTDALAERDVLALHRGALAALVKATSVKVDRYSRSEVKFIRTVDVAVIQKQVDDLAKQYRRLDTRIQEANWRAELIES